ncbi:fibronectin type III domain-containing protein 11 [Cyrtonyx montezumae]|uniref:fibronectin type III domain-containing protein 11 n=1 Tax=Cyrtonyx montezumae TaxID=9017 RepID=UPI0032DBB5C0
MATAEACRLYAARPGAPGGSRSGTDLPGWLWGEAGIPKAGQASFGIMNVDLNEYGTSLESAVCSTEGQEICKRYYERRNLLLQYLQSDLSLHVLKKHQKNVELLKKSYYYLEVQPSFLILRDENFLAIPTNIFQVIDQWKFQKVKKLGRSLAKIQMQLLTHLFEQLQQGREELISYVENYDVVTFLSKWDSILQRMSDLSETMKSLLSLQMKKQLYTKHHLVSCEDVRSGKIPDIRLFFCAKVPVTFDQKESFVHKNMAHLKWVTEIQESPLEQYELHFKLLKHETQVGFAHCGFVTCSTTTCIIHNLLPNQSYEFMIRRVETFTLVYEPWHDTIVLMTEANEAEEESTRELKDEVADKNAF